MFKRIILMILLVSLINYFFGCTRIVKQDVEHLEGAEEKIVEVVLVNGNTIRFTGESGSYKPSKDAVLGYVNDTLFREIPREDILYVKVERSDPAKSIIAVVGIIFFTAAAVVGIIGATKESCPFVYSFDGEKFVFDAEPLGGAICKGLERLEYSELEYLKSSEGKYKLLIRNEVEESQYLDEIKLAIIDHDPEKEVVTDFLGNVYLIDHPIIPMFAKDENDNDLMNFIRESDGTFWQTKLPVNGRLKEQDIRHHMIFKFPKPEKTDKVNLIVNAGTALWGSHMIRSMLQMRGDGIENWYQNIYTGNPKYEELFDFNIREELYLLKIHVYNGKDWVEKGIINGGGPLITEKRLISLDLRDIPGDSLYIKVNPPKGFWTLDYIAVDYNKSIKADIIELPIAKGNDIHGSDVCNVLSNPDSEYLIMPEINDWASIEFNAPDPIVGKERTILLKSFGYYEIHIDKTLPEQKELIATMLATPGEIVKYALKEYAKWYADMSDEY